MGKRQGSKSAYTRAQIERAARMYRTDADAARAVGMAGGASFRRCCARFDIETPNERSKKKTN